MGRAGYEAELEVGTMEGVNQQPGQTDCVIMIDGLEHPVDGQRALERSKEWLAPGRDLGGRTLTMTARVARLTSSG